MKTTNAPSAAALRSTLLDPAVNILIQKLRQELVTTKAKLEDTQNELSAWKFTPDRFYFYYSLFLHFNLCNYNLLYVFIVILEKD
jgi:hypothetical protein